MRHPQFRVSTVSRETKYPLPSRCLRRPIQKYLRFALFFPRSVRSYIGAMSTIEETSRLRGLATSMTPARIVPSTRPAVRICWPVLVQEALGLAEGRRQPLSTLVRLIRKCVHLAMLRSNADFPSQRRPPVRQERVLELLRLHQLRVSVR